jgi:CheY-like chemotaxis protein
MARVLLVEPEIALRASVAHSLTTIGYEVTDVANGAQALALLQQERFDLVIASAETPYLSGVELGEVVRSLYRQIPFVLLMPHVEDTFDPAQLEDLVINVKVLLSSRASTSTDILRGDAHGTDVCECGHEGHGPSGCQNPPIYPATICLPCEVHYPPQC